MVVYKVFIDSGLVCKPNIIQSAKIYRYLIKNGHEISGDESNADYIIINSCGSTNTTQKRYIRLYEKYTSLKKTNAKIIMYGCLVKIDKELVNSLDVIPISFEETEKLDEIFYNNKIRFNSIRPYCDEETKDKVILEKKRFLFRTGMTNQIKEFLTAKHALILAIIFSRLSKRVKLNYEWIRYNASEKNRIFVEICSGCTGNCSFCVIKRAKGKIRSREIKKILKDTAKIYDPAKNLWLVADDCSSFGLEKGSNLLELIDELNRHFPNLSLDLEYISPLWLQKYSKDYIKLFKKVSVYTAIVPMQTGSNRIVKKMNRHYDVDKVIETVKKIKKVSPKTVLFSQFIVGFPGESTIDFLKTVKAARNFDFPMYYRYSDMKGTAAYYLPNKKSNIVILLRYLLIIIFTNIFVLKNLISNSRAFNTSNDK